MSPNDRVPTDEEALEELVDDYGIDLLLEAIAEICHHKAEYLRINEHDGRSAKVWDLRGRSLTALASKAAFFASVQEAHGLFRRQSKFIRPGSPSLPEDDSS